MTVMKNNFFNLAAQPSQTMVVPNKLLKQNKL